MLDLSRSRILTGFGPGSFEYVYNTNSVSYLKYAHNAPLQILVELGLPGLIIVLAAAFTGVRAIIRNFYFTRTPQKKVLVTSLLTGITAFLLHNLADFDIYNFELAAAFILILAVLMSQVTIGLIEIKKIKLTYLLGLNPGKRRSIVFAAVLMVTLLSAVTAGKFTPVLSLIYVFIAVMAAIWSVSKEDLRSTNLDLPVLFLIIMSAVSLTYTPDLHSGIKYFMLFISAAAVLYFYSQFLRRYTFKIITANFLIWSGVILSVIAISQAIYRQVTHWQGGFYADAFFPNSNIFACYIVIPFGFLFSRVLFERKISLLWLKIAGLFLIIAALGLARSKAGSLQLILVSAGLWLQYARGMESIKDTESRRALKSRVIKSVFAFALITAFTPLFPSGMKMLSAGSDTYLLNRP
ncbi:MAG TPA: hypothetical protein P5511_09060, partial [Candidatus Goldiibacteriota bacterium]|nr:hypothetical protein [Candidatus Goldiibacteriota bacterium]